MSSLSPRSSLTRAKPKVACSIQSFVLLFIPISDNRREEDRTFAALSRPSAYLTTLLAVPTPRMVRIDHSLLDQEESISNLDEIWLCRVGVPPCISRSRWYILRHSQNAVRSASTDAGCCCFCDCVEKNRLKSPRSFPRLLSIAPNGSPQSVYATSVGTAPSSADGAEIVNSSVSLPHLTSGRVGPLPSAAEQAIIPVADETTKIAPVFYCYSSRE
jgi:hypothetical protein